MTIKGYVRDRQPNKKQPALELYFNDRDRSALPKGAREPIVLDLNGVCWEGTINTTNPTNPTNPPYVHTFLTRGHGLVRCTEVFLKLELVENAQIEFDLQGSTLRLISIPNKGHWRLGNEPHERWGKDK